MLVTIAWIQFGDLISSVNCSIQLIDLLENETDNLLPFKNLHTYGYFTAHNVIRISSFEEFLNL